MYPGGNMMGISSDKSLAFVVYCCVFFCSASATANNSGDLLVDEQWAIESSVSHLTNTRFEAVPATSTGEPRGTCATTPVINGDTYTCDSFTAPSNGDVDINVAHAWELIPADGPEVVIGLIDTGIDYLHPDLREKVWKNTGEMLFIDANTNGIDDGCEDGVDLDSNGYPDDCHGINTRVSRLLADGSLNPLAGDPMDTAVGHGTNMAGVMGAVGNNGSADFHGGIVGVTGFHNNIRIATCAAADLQSDVYVTIPGLIGAYGTHDAILACFDYFAALRERGVNLVVINGSGGASTLNNLNNIIIPVAQVRDKYLLNTPAMKAAVDRIAALDINLVVAAGNNSWDIDRDQDRAYFPAAFSQDNIIAVGAINNQAEPWRYSSYGRWSVDVFAPGERILSTNPRAEITGTTPAEYVVSDGTSQATAFVSGMIALAKSYPATAHLSAEELRRLLISSGKSLASIEAKSVSGKLARLVDDNQSGMINCSNQLFERRHWPRENQTQVLPGNWFQLEVASYNCHQASGQAYLTASIFPTGESFLLLDDGSYPDKTANDGIYTGQWLVPNELDTYQISWGTDTATQMPDMIDLHTTIITDNDAANTERSGSWWLTIFRPGFYGHNYRIAYESGERAFTWKPQVTEAGYYEVLAHWPSYSGFTSHAEYSISHGNSHTQQQTMVVADQSQNGGQWNSLGVYWFGEGEFPVTLTNQNIDAAVVADAIKLRPVSP